MGCLDIEPGTDKRADHGPLVQPEAVHHDEHCPAVQVQYRSQELGANVNRQWRTVAITLVQPFRVVPLQVAGKILSEAILQGSQSVLQAWLVRLPEPDFPLSQLHHQLDPLTPRERPTSA